MFRIESYVTPILLSYVDKYVRDFKPNDAQVSLWGGGVVLHNLVLKTEVIQKEVPLPFTLVSGRIHELLIQVPWTKIISEPIIVTIDTIECILGSTPPEQEPPPPTTQRRSTLTEVEEPPPGYMQALVRRIVSNITLKVHHLIVKYAHDDIVLSLNIKHLSVDSTGPDWVPTFTDVDQKLPIMRRLVKLDNLTLCLDQCDSDGKIRYYQEPLLYRCQIEIRVLIRLISATIRKPSHLGVQILCERLAWGITTDQMLLLINLAKQHEEQQKAQRKTAPPTVPEKKVTKPPLVKKEPVQPVESNQQSAIGDTQSTDAQPNANAAQNDTWSSWAWSWLPMSGVPQLPNIEIPEEEEMPVFAGPTPFQVSVYCKELSLALKVMEFEGSLRKRPRPILEVDTRHLSVKSFILKPTKTKVRMGLRSLTVLSHGKCVCGHYDNNASHDQPTLYVSEKETEPNTSELWSFPQQEFERMTFEAIEVEEDEFTDTAPVKPKDLSKEVATEFKQDSKTDIKPVAKTGSKTDAKMLPKKDKKDNPKPKDEFWDLLQPIFYVEFRHERNPPNILTDPYEDPPEDFEYSDWVEEFQLIVQQKKSLTCRLCTGLFHRITALTNILKQMNTEAPPLLPPRTLTVEECDALMENLPQKRIHLLLGDMTVRMFPWDHSLTEKPQKSPLVVELNIKNAALINIAPMYAHRVCSAVCQMPDAPDFLKQATKSRATLTLPSLEASLYSVAENKSKPCCRLDAQIVINDLLHKHLFNKPDTVTLNYTAQIKDANLGGSTPRLLAFYFVIMSLASGRPAQELKMTSIKKDAIKDEKAVALDMSLEECFGRGFITRNTISHVTKIQAIRITALHAPQEGSVKQAWIFSAPDIPSSTPYLRSAIQWCWRPLPNTIDYFGVWTEPNALSIDPLLVGWLAYRPKIKLRPNLSTQPNNPVSRTITSSLYLTMNRRRITPPPSSSGRGVSRSGSGVEVHSRCRSTESGSSEKKPKSSKEEAQKEKELIKAEELLKWHDRLQHVLVTLEFGLVLVYVTVTTVSAVNCTTLRSAMENHAAASHKVLVISVGRWNIHSNVLTKHLWEKVKYDRPSFLAPSDADLATSSSTSNHRSQAKFNKPPSFPWKFKLADVSCYTLEVRAGSEYSGSVKVKRSQLKSHIVTQRTILELVTTTITGSLVTKSVKSTQQRARQKRKVVGTDTAKPASEEEDDQVKYFTTGADFKPTTLKEFLRGPENSRSQPEPPQKEKAAKPQKQHEPKQDQGPQRRRDPIEMMCMGQGQDGGGGGPISSVGANIYAETQPMLIKLDNDQIMVIAVAIHSFNHLIAYINKSPFITPLNLYKRFRSTRSLYEVEETADSEGSTTTRSGELVPIFDPYSPADPQDQIKLTKFLCFQWVVNKITSIFTLNEDKIVVQFEDAISSVDFQNVYNQVKVKMTSAFVKTYRRVNDAEDDEWEPGPMGGRVLETREAATEKDDTLFLSVTVTRAKISSLPLSWKEELHPKLLENAKANQGYMWEIYATLAPLEILLENRVIENLVFIMSGLESHTKCDLGRSDEVERSSSPTSEGQEDMPYFYLILGGIRVIAYTTIPDENQDDTVILSISKSSITPYPDNPICRRSINTTSESSTEGRQYEMFVKAMTMKTTRFDSLLAYETKLNERKAGQDNPAAHWSETHLQPELTHIIRPLDLSCVFAPPHYVSNVLTCGTALELNLISDCIIELSVEQIKLISLLNLNPANFSTSVRNQRELIESSSIENLATKGECMYAALIEELNFSGYNYSDESDTDEKALKNSNLTTRYKDQAEDSGTDMMSVFGGSQLRYIPEQKGKGSVMFDSNTSRPNSKDYLELFVTMGTVDITIQAEDNGSSLIEDLKPPAGVRRVFSENLNQSKKGLSCVKLFYIILYQPNMYYWTNKTYKTLQLSLFNLWMGLGASPHGPEWHTALLNTATGQPDRETDIRPALATLKLILPAHHHSGGFATNTRGLFDLNIERPVLFDISSDKIRRMKLTKEFFDLSFASSTNKQHTGALSNAPQVPLILAVKRKFMKLGIETATVRTSQLGVVGKEGCAGWDSSSLQVAVDARPDRVLVRSLIAAAVVTVGLPDEARRTVMLPMHVGTEFDCCWDSWNKVDENTSYPKATVYAHVEIDNLIFDICPEDLSVVTRLKNALQTGLDAKKPIRRRYQQEETQTPTSAEATSATAVTTAVEITPEEKKTLETTSNTMNETPIEEASKHRLSTLNFRDSYSFIMGPTETAEAESENYYKDDLRSGAFKIIRGTHMPMAYQVVLHGTAVSWCYPHPRAITKLVAYPLPGQNEEIECVLECFNKMQRSWESHTYFTIPVLEEKEIQLYVPPPEGIFATLWRYRLSNTETEKFTPHLFNSEKFMPSENPFEVKYEPDATETRTYTVSAEELSGVLRVDSHFAPHLMPALHLNVLLNRLEFHGYNSILPLADSFNNVEGYYVSKHLMKSHRVLNLMAHQTSIYGELGSPTGELMLFKSQFSADALNSEIQVMEEFIDKFNVQAGVSICPAPRMRYRTRFHATSIRLGLNTPRLRTLKTLIADFQYGAEKALNTARSAHVHVPLYSEKRRELDSMQAFEGKVCYWVYNTSTESLRVGQVGTDEDIPIGSGVKIAYNWRHPQAEKKLRFSLNRPSAESVWSEGIDFDITHTRIRLVQKEQNSESEDIVALHIRTVTVGTMRCMQVGGRLIFANMLRFNLTYKLRLVQSNFLDKRQSLLTGDIPAETIVPSFFCEATADMFVKIKFSNHNASWSGDIPMKECPKENYPWLVKVPAEGEMSYISVWCRIINTKLSERILVTFWPLYMLYSHLSQDIDVLVVSELPDNEKKPEMQSITTAPLLQAAQGRGAITHILAPGTTSARHKLSFQYRDLECQVTRDAVDLHYGMTEFSVFNPEPQPDFILPVLDQLDSWQRFTSREGKGDWPYSIVTKHWRGTWQPALLQPRCDINVNYRAVRVGGGCSLQLLLSPVALLCNASPITLTLRAHDAAPLCRVEPGIAISPPTSITAQPFFLSVELNRDTFVSRQLELFTSDPGPYQDLPPGNVAVDRPTNFAVQCKPNQKVAFLTLYYEIIHNINVFGISSTFNIINNLGNNVLVSAMTTVDDPRKIKPLAAQGYTTLEPTPKNSINGVQLYKFSLRDRWQGSDESELNTYILVSLPISDDGDNALQPTSDPVPVRLTTTTSKRNAIALVDNKKKSMPVVVTQQRHEGRWLVRIAKDPCPQYVVHNGTRHRIALAEPTTNEEHEDNTTPGVSVIPDCKGIRWNCIVNPKSVLHYSTPSHCARHPSNDDTKEFVPMLTFSRIEGDNEFTWSQPVEVADGELLLQLPSHNTTVKLSIYTHPYSTLIDIQAVKDTDIAASDVRRRIMKASSAKASPLLSETSTDYFSPSGSVINIISQYKIDRTDSQSNVFAQNAEKEVKLKESEEIIEITETVIRIQSFEEEEFLSEKNPPSENLRRSNQPTANETELAEAKTPNMEKSSKEHESNLNKTPKEPSKEDKSKSSKTPVEQPTEDKEKSKEPLEEITSRLQKTSNTKEPIAGNTPQLKKADSSLIFDIKEPSAENEIEPLKIVPSADGKQEPSQTSATKDPPQDPTLHPQLNNSCPCDDASTDTLDDWPDSKDPSSTQNTPLQKPPKEPLFKDPQPESPKPVPQTSTQKIPVSDKEPTTSSTLPLKQESQTEMQKPLPQTSTQKTPDSKKEPTARSILPLKQEPQPEALKPVPQTNTQKTSDSEKEPTTRSILLLKEEPQPEALKPVPQTNTQKTSDSEKEPTTRSILLLKEEPQPEALKPVPQTNTQKTSDSEKEPTTRSILPLKEEPQPESQKPVPRNSTHKTLDNGKEPTARSITTLKQDPPPESLKSVPQSSTHKMPDSEKEQTAHSIMPLKQDVDHTSAQDIPSGERIFRTKGNDDIIVVQSWHSEDDASIRISETFLVTDMLRGLIDSIAIEVSASSLHKPLFAVYLDRAAFLISSEPTRQDMYMTLEDVQVDNLHHDSGLYDFAVVGTSRTTPFSPGRCPGLWNMFFPQETFNIKDGTAKLLLSATYDTWDVAGYHFQELTEILLKLGPLALYLEDAFINALEELHQKAVPQSDATPSKESHDDGSTRAMAEAQAIQKPLVLRKLNIEPIDVSLTLHTAVKMYIALDRSPLHLNAFRRENIMVSRERLAHSCTVHYLSAVILGAGWVVGGLELLGAPGAFAARVGNATGGVKGIASAAAAGIVRSLSALASSLARNLDILAGDEEHARRAAAARRQTPDSFISGVITGLTNFAINILGAVGGLAHHPVVGVATGESESSAQALRRSLLGALTKPLSATADLVAYAGHGLLNQTGWDPTPQPRAVWVPHETLSPGWRRDCVRYKFRFGDLRISYGFSSLFKNAPVHLLIANKFLVVVESDTDNILEMIEFNHCYLRPCAGNIIEIEILYPPRKASKAISAPPRDNEDAEMSAAAMARVAKFTGAEERRGTGEVRLLQLIPATGEAYSLHASLATAIHANKDTHFHFH